MGRWIERQGLIVFIACVVASASMIGISARVHADTENETVQPDMFLALFYEMDKGVTLKFSITSSVPIYIYVLDTTNYNSYSSSGTIPSALYRTISPVSSAESSVEAPATGRYYLIMENSASTQTASVTIDYSFEGTGLSLTGLGYAMIIGGIVGIVAFAVVGAMVLKRRKSKQQGQLPGQRDPGQQWQPPMPPPQP
jgi:hypothetical protein